MSIYVLKGRKSGDYFQSDDIALTFGPLCLACAVETRDQAELLAGNLKRMYDVDVDVERLEKGATLPMQTKANPETAREDQLYIALQKCAGALEAVFKDSKKRWSQGESSVIIFTGAYADLGTMTVSQILDEANEALEEK
jgi:hypothetical protein